MGNLEFNKIFAAILIAGIVAMLSGFIADELIHTDRLEEDAIPVEGVEGPVSSEVAQKEELPEPILAMIADADPMRGEKISRACASCHSFDKGGRHGVGPNLWNVVGAEKQAKDGYNYSGALDEQGEARWTYLSLNKYLWKPKWYAPGTKMNYIGLRKAEDRADLIAWLRTLADEQPPFPDDAAIEAEVRELKPELVEKVDNNQESNGQDQEGTEKSGNSDRKEETE